MEVKAIVVSGSVQGEGTEEFFLLVPADTDEKRFAIDLDYVERQTIASVVDRNWASRIVTALNHAASKANGASHGSR